MLAGTAVSIAGLAVPIWPFALVGAALALGDKAKVLKGESFHEDEALLLWTLWLEKNDDDWVDEASFAKAFNKQRKIYKRPPMTGVEMTPLIRQMEKQRIVVRTAIPAGWNVKERISVA